MSPEFLRRGAFLVVLLAVGIAVPRLMPTGGQAFGAPHASWLAVSKASADEPSGEAPFLAANDAAMNKMMSGMAVKPTGDVDADFADMMIPHHQGAIEMAEAELRFGHDERLRRIAEEIIVGQQAEIAAMRLARDQIRPLNGAPAKQQP